MANLTLKDTGYANVESTGTIETDIANSGTALELKGVSIVYNRSASTERIGEPGDYGLNKINHVSNNSPSISITGILQRGKLDGTGTSVDDLPAIEEMVTTLGIKCIYYNDAVADTTGYPILTKFLGVTDAFTNHPTEKHLHVKFSSINITQTADNNSYTFRLEGEVTK